MSTTLIRNKKEEREEKIWKKRYLEEFLPLCDGEFNGIVDSNTWISYRVACRNRDREIDKLKKEVAKLKKMIKTPKKVGKK